MSFSKHESQILLKGLDFWQSQSLISGETYENLKATLNFKFNWQRLAKHLIWISLSCLLISVAAFFTDDYILMLIKKTPKGLRAFILLILSFILIYLGFKFKHREILTIILLLFLSIPHILVIGAENMILFPILVIKKCTKIDP